MFAPEDPLDGLRGEVEKLLASEEPIDHVAMCQLAEQVEFLRVRSLRVYDRSEQWRADGFLSAAAAIRAQTNTNQGSVHASLKLAEKLESLPETSFAFSRGQITRAHAFTITDACTPQRLDALRDVEEQLVEVARRTQPKQLRGVVRRLTDALDGDDGRSAAAKDYEARKAFLSPTLRGRYHLDGELDALGGDMLATALNALMELDHPEGDTRTRPQRRADALVEMARRVLDSGLEITSRGARPHLMYVLDVEQLTPDLVAHARAESTKTGHLSKATLDAIACDCSVSRVIMAGKSEVLDVGRTTRAIPTALWKALVARDRGCTHPGATSARKGARYITRNPGKKAAKRTPKTPNSNVGATTSNTISDVDSRESEFSVLAAEAISFKSARSRALIKRRRSPALNSSYVSLA